MRTNRNFSRLSRLIKQGSEYLDKCRDGVRDKGYAAALLQLVQFDGLKSADIYATLDEIMELYRLEKQAELDRYRQEAAAGDPEAAENYAWMVLYFDFSLKDLALAPSPPAPFTANGAFFFRH